MLKISLIGAKGRMGGAFQSLVGDLEDVDIVRCPARGALHAEDFAAADVVVDFTTAGETARFAAMAADAGTAYVVGTTGLSQEDEKALDEAAHRIAVVQAGNFSIGIAVLEAMVEQAARLLTGFDVAVSEIHHRGKKDAPSGTAKMLQSAAIKGGACEAPIQALRAGSVIGEHSVVFAGAAERLTFTHQAEDRSLFARGALDAAQFAVGAPAGRYSMQDVLGIRL